MKIDNIKNLSFNKGFYKKLFSIIISIIVIIVSYNILSQKGREAQDVIPIVMVKRSEDIKKDSVITKDNVSKYQIIKKEFNEDMIKYEDVEKIKGKFAYNILRRGTPIYKDEIGEEKSLKNEWLYNLEDGKEVVTIPYNYLEAGGDILIPGDKVRVRVSYEVSEFEGGNSTELLFNSIIVKDLLNSKGHSIYEVYKQTNKLPEEEKQKVLEGKNFVQEVLPRALVLEAKSEHIDKFAKYNSKTSKKYLITILKRNIENVNK